MPFTGGASPSPERTGAGEGINSNVPLVQRIYETIARGRGSAYDQSWPPTTAVGIENFATARAIAFDGWGTNQRLANECNPGKATVTGLLPRWERILNCPPNPGDPQPVRQARCAAALARFGKGSIGQAVVDALTAALGPLFVSVQHFDETNDLVWWPGATGTGATVTAVTGGTATIAGLANIPSAAPGANLLTSGFSHAGNNSQSLFAFTSFPIQSWISSTSVVVVNPNAVAPDSGGNWTLVNYATPWMSTIDILNVLVTQNISGYANTDGSPNAAFYAQVAQIGPVLDQLLRADMMWQWYVLGIGGATGWLLDQPDLDLLAFDV